MVWLKWCGCYWFLFKWFASFVRDETFFSFIFRDSRPFREKSRWHAIRYFANWLNVKLCFPILKKIMFLVYVCSLSLLWIGEDWGYIHINWLDQFVLNPSLCVVHVNISVILHTTSRKSELNWLYVCISLIEFAMLELFLSQILHSIDIFFTYFLSPLHLLLKVKIVVMRMRRKMYLTKSFQNTNTVGCCVMKSINLVYWRKGEKNCFAFKSCTHNRIYELNLWQKILF